MRLFMNAEMMEISHAPAEGVAVRGFACLGACIQKQEGHGKTWHAGKEAEEEAQAQCSSGRHAACPVLNAENAQQSRDGHARRIPCTPAALPRDVNGASAEGTPRRGSHVSAVQQQAQTAESDAPCARGRATAAQLAPERPRTATERVSSHHGCARPPHERPPMSRRMRCHHPDGSQAAGSCRRSQHFARPAQ